jgi:hypothetical protein
MYCGYMRWGEEWKGRFRDEEGVMDRIWLIGVGSGGRQEEGRRTGSRSSKGSGKARRRRRRRRGTRQYLGVGCVMHSMQICAQLLGQGVCEIKRRGGGFDALLVRRGYVCLCVDDVYMHQKHQRLNDRGEQSQCYTAQRYRCWVQLGGATVSRSFRNLDAPSRIYARSKRLRAFDFVRWPPLTPARP